MAEENSAEEKEEQAKEEEVREPENNKIILSMLLLTFFMVILTMGVIFRNTPEFAEPEYKSTESISAATAVSSEISSEAENPFPININTASEETLQLIPDIGPVTAKMITDFRDICGTITEFEQLLSIDGIGEKTVEVLEKYCYIG